MLKNRKFLVLLCLFIVLVLAVGVVAAQPKNQSAGADQKARMGIMSAFDDEMTLLLEEADINKEVVIDGKIFYVGHLRGVPVVMVRTGISMVNAASTTADLISHFNITHLVFSGIAGGVNPALHIGDVTIPTKWGQYLEGFFAREEDGEFNLPFWASSDYANYGMMYIDTVCVFGGGSPVDECQEKFWFNVDPEMLEIATITASEVVLDQCIDANTCLEHPPQVVVGGNGVSGQRFVDNAQFREYAWDNLSADALDMETAAVSQVAFEKSVPMIAFRSLSDLAGGGPGENQVGIFFGIAADNSANVVLAFLQNWAEAH